MLFKTILKLCFDFLIDVYFFNTDKEFTCFVYFRPEARAALKPKVKVELSR